jgi:hypothetical protein
MALASRRRACLTQLDDPANMLAHMSSQAARTWSPVVINLILRLCCKSGRALVYDILTVDSGDFVAASSTNLFPWQTSSFVVEAISQHLSTRFSSTFIGCES